jgi:hypothetical protein
LRNFVDRGCSSREEADIIKLKDVITYSLSGFFIGLLNKFSKALEEKKPSK